MTRFLRIAAVITLLLPQAAAPVSAAADKFIGGPAATRGGVYLVLEPPIGITPIQIARFNVSIMASPRDAASNTESQCVWPVSIRFANEAGKQVGPETKFMLKRGESGHGDLDGVMAQPTDQHGRAQVRPVGVIGPVDVAGIIGPPDINETPSGPPGKCAAVIGASLEVFDKGTGATVATIDQFVLVPVDRAEPPPSPIEP